MTPIEKDRAKGIANNLKQNRDYFLKNMCDGDNCIYIKRIYPYHAAITETSISSGRKIVNVAIDVLYIMDDYLELLAASAALFELLQGNNFYKLLNEESSSSR